LIDQKGYHHGIWRSQQWVRLVVTAGLMARLIKTTKPDSTYILNRKFWYIRQGIAEESVKTGVALSEDRYKVRFN